MAGGANVFGHPTLALDQRNDHCSHDSQIARTTADAHVASSRDEFDRGENCLGRAGAGPGVRWLESHVYAVIVRRIELGGGGSAMAGWAARVRRDFGHHQHECAADFKRAEFGGRRIFVPPGWRAARNVSDRGLNELHELATGLHEYLAGQWGIANWGPAGRSISAALLPSGKDTVTGPRDRIISPTSQVFWRPKSFMTSACAMTTSGSRCNASK